MDIKNMLKRFWQRHRFKIVALFVLLLPICAYIINFGTHQISDDPAMWGVFGDYIGGVYNVLVAILVFYISHNLDKKEERHQKRARVAHDIKIQIEKFESSGNKTKTLERLANLILSNKEILGHSTFRMLMSLDDNFQKVVNENIPINSQLQQDAIAELISIYEE